MQNFKKIFLISCLAIILSTSFSSQNSQKAYAANIFGITDPAGCESKDPFLPNLVICGRNPASTGSCTAYTQPCSIGDLVQTGSRILIWIISIALLIIPLIAMYYGAMIIIYQQEGMPTKIKDLKTRIWKVLVYFILMLAAWLIVKTVVDVFQVDPRINTFLIDQNGNQVKAQQFNTN